MWLLRGERKWQGGGVSQNYRLDVSLRCHLVVEASHCRHLDSALSSIWPFLFSPFLLLFNKYFLSSYCVSSTVPSLGTQQWVWSGADSLVLLGHPSSLPCEPQALNSPLQDPGKEPVYTAGPHRAVRTRAGLRDTSAQSATRGDTGPPSAPTSNFSTQGTGPVFCLQESSMPA